MTDINESKITSKLSDEILIDQMIEECSELIHALSKLSRKLRGENPTPIDIESIRNNVIEEFSDVILCSKLLYIYPDNDIMLKKLKRWIERLCETNQ
jgi:hypothetical protein